jgi:cephalosporin hydroxylase
MPSIANDWTKIEAMNADYKSKDLLNNYFILAREHLYSYNFTWLGLPIIQHPADIMALQEIIWETRPDLVVETGIAHGGSLIFYASLLHLLDGGGRVLGIDIDIRSHNRERIETHPLSRYITMLEGSSLDYTVVEKVFQFAADYKKIMVVLDSSHTHDHVLQELFLYSPLVKKDCYLVVCDTRIEDMPAELFTGKLWEKGNNPKTAVWEFLKTNSRFVVDKNVEKRILLTGLPDGFLRCIRE